MQSRAAPRPFQTVPAGCSPGGSLWQMEAAGAAQSPVCPGVGERCGHPQPHQGRVRAGAAFVPLGLGKPGRAGGALGSAFEMPAMRFGF